jgi:hypothetical protein
MGKKTADDKIKDTGTKYKEVTVRKRWKGHGKGTYIVYTIKVPVAPEPAPTPVAGHH